MDRSSALTNKLFIHVDKSRGHLAHGMHESRAMPRTPGLKSSREQSNGMPGCGQPTPTPRKFMARLRSRRSDSAHRLNLKFLRRTIRLAKPYWLSDEKRKARWLLFLLMLLLVGYTEVAVLFNQQSGEFTSAL